ncbi:hypothetical protein [Paraburkholderia sediminicola]|uniref:hypothetical protein n=1 Tax=Paraburkholderia sediminicola TaxID=458836 RepID=UPI0038B8F74C
MMRKTLFALDEHPGNMPAMNVLSLEEAELMEAEAMQDEVHIDRTLAGAARMLEVSDGLEELAITLDRVGEATDTELALVDNATQLAVAGSDLEPERLMPATEQYLGRRIATENLRANARRIFANIQALLKQVWAHIGRYFQVAMTIPTLENTMDQLVRDISRRSPKLRANLQPLRFGHSSLVFDGAVVKSGRELKAGLEANAEAARYVFDSNPVEVAAFGEELAKIIATFTPETALEVVGAARALCEKQSRTKLPLLSVTRPEGDFLVQQSRPLMGGGDLRLKTYVRNDGATMLGALDHFRKTGLVFNNDAPVRGQEVIFQELSFAEMRELLRTCYDLLRQIKDFHGGNA